MEQRVSLGLLPGKQIRLGTWINIPSKKSSWPSCRRVTCKEHSSLPIYVLRSLPRDIPHKYFKLVMVMTCSTFLCHMSKRFCRRGQLMYFTVFGTQTTKDWELKLFCSRFEWDISLFAVLKSASSSFTPSAEKSGNFNVVMTVVVVAGHGGELGWRGYFPLLRVVHLV